MDLNNIKSMVMRVTGRPLALAQKYSPELLLGAGIATGIASVILASKATLSPDKVLGETSDQIKRIKEAEKEFDKDIKEDIAESVNTAFGANIVKVKK